MTEPTITCPNCKKEIKLNESLAAPLIEATRKQFEQQLAKKESDIAQREQAMRDKAKQLAEDKLKQDEQVAHQVAEQLKAERARVIAEESRKAKFASAAELENKARELAELQEVLQQNNGKLAEAQKAQAELIKKQRELDDAKRELELTVEKRVQEGLTATRQQAKKEAEDEQRLKVMEKEQTIAAMQKQIEDLKRRAEQGSQQLQGEVQELELENLLRTKFPFDAIEPVVKGETHDLTVLVCPDSRENRCPSVIWWSDAASDKEERRLAFVAVTRTQGDLILCVSEQSLARLQKCRADFFQSFEHMSISEFITKYSDHDKAEAQSSIAH
jgi:hypothetical protein